MFKTSSKVLFSIATFTGVAFSAAASANTGGERWPSWYVGISGGVQFLQESDLGGTSTGNLDFDQGAAFTGSVGYYIPSSAPLFNALRIEGELGYRFADLGDFSYGGTTGSADGDMQITSYMANLYYDFRNETSWTPYFGGGAGGAHVVIDGNTALNVTNDKDDVFAYQFMAGLMYAPGNIPLTEWGIGYRYFATMEPEFGTTGGGTLELEDIASHAVEVNAKFKF